MCSRDEMEKQLIQGAGRGVQAVILWSQQPREEWWNYSGKGIDATPGKYNATQ